MSALRTTLVAVGLGAAGLTTTALVVTSATAAPAPVPRDALMKGPFRAWLVGTARFGVACALWTWADRPMWACAGRLRAG
jgi:hypothetical protein